METLIYNKQTINTIVSRPKDTHNVGNPIRSIDIEPLGMIDTFGLHLGSVRPNLADGGKCGPPYRGCERENPGGVRTARSIRLNIPRVCCQRQVLLKRRAISASMDSTKAHLSALSLEDDRWVELRFLDMRGSSAQFAICGQ